MENIRYKIIPTSKSIAIIALTVLAVFLAMQLWLISIPNRSFFPYMEARFATAVPDTAVSLVRPKRIISGAGDGYFNITYSSIGSYAPFAYGRHAISTILDRGSFVQVNDAQRQLVFELPVIILEYALGLDSAIFASAMGHRSAANITAAGVQNFDAVAIFPPMEEGGMLTVFFICHGSGYTWQFIANNVNHFYVESAADSHRPFVQGEVPFTFNAALTHQFTYYPLLAINPYENEFGQLHQGFIHSRVAHFFDNPTTMNRGLAGEIYTFSNLNTVVRYLPYDVLEYTSFRTIGRRETGNFRTNFLRDFSAAIDFIAQDRNVRNETFLAAHETRGRENVFWFGIAVENFPIVIEAPWYAHSHCTEPMHHPIEVIVDQGRVIRYRKIPYVFVPDTGVRGSLSSRDLAYDQFAFPFSQDTRGHVLLAPRPVVMEVGYGV